MHIIAQVILSYSLLKFFSLFITMMKNNNITFGNHKFRHTSWETRSTLTCDDATAARAGEMELATNDCDASGDTVVTSWGWLRGRLLWRLCAAAEGAAFAVVAVTFACCKREAG